MMLKPIIVALAGFAALASPPRAAAQGAVDGAAIDDLVLASRILANEACSMPMVM